MSAPRLVIDLAKIDSNARQLVTSLGKHGIAVTAVVKASLGSVEIAKALLRADVQRLGDSRIENIQSMSAAGVVASMTLIRSPMLSQVRRVVRYADTSFNTEPSVIEALSEAARETGRRHGIVLMVELGDLREGILPADLDDIARQVLTLPNLELVGIGTNLACRSGVVPDAANMAELSALADGLDDTFGMRLAMVSGGNSANLGWVAGGAFALSGAGRVNDLRLGEAILLGREPLHRQPIAGLHTDAITLVAEVIESKYKPSRPTGTQAQAAFGEARAAVDRGSIAQSVLALGRQDVDPAGLCPPAGIDILDASSDHLVVAGERCLPIGCELTFQLDYSALLRAMTSPFVTKMTINASVADDRHRGSGRRCQRAADTLDACSVCPRSNCNAANAA